MAPPRTSARRGAATGPALVVVTAVVAMLAAAATPVAAVETEVAIEPDAFAPARVTAAMGPPNEDGSDLAAHAHVRWVLRDPGGTHQVVSDADQFAGSHRMTTARPVYEVSLFRTGTYRYHCAIHPEMTGTVTVTGTGPALEAAPPPDASSSPGGGRVVLTLAAAAVVVAGALAWWLRRRRPSGG